MPLGSQCVCTYTFCKCFRICGFAATFIFQSHMHHDRPPPPTMSLISVFRQNYSGPITQSFAIILEHAEAESSNCQFSDCFKCLVKVKEQICVKALYPSAGNTCYIVVECLCLVLSSVCASIRAHLQLLQEQVF